MTSCCCLLIETFNPRIGCNIKRGNRPCLICPGTMDLVEFSQATTFLFGFPICFVDHYDTLDCQKCGYSTSVESYSHLLACSKLKKPAQAFGAGNSVDTGSTVGLLEDGYNDNSDSKVPSSSSSSSCLCQGCKSSILNLQWKYCPKCGELATNTAMAALSEGGEGMIHSTDDGIIDEEDGLYVYFDEKRDECNQQRGGGFSLLDSSSWNSCSTRRVQQQL